MQSNIRYRIYPSLLDQFQRLMNADAAAESFENTDAEGNPRWTAEELVAMRERSLLDSVNRVEREPSEAMERGTAFNDAVDSVGGRGCGTSGVEALPSPEDGTPLVRAERCGFLFDFDGSLVDEVNTIIGQHAVAQWLCRATIDTAFGAVELYGYADEIVRSRVIDLKTTARYTFGQYERGWQKDVYPFCLVESGEMESVCEFEYLVAVLSGPTAKRPWTAGKVYREVYTYDHEAARGRLRGMLESFIGWLEAHRGEITDTKIFGGDAERV